MFTGLMVNAWIVGSVVAAVAGVVGLFVVLRGSAFVAHAIPQCGFAGAAGANLIGASTLGGLGVFAVLSALGIAWLGRRARHDVATALALVTMLGLGSLFLSFSVEYAPEIYSLLFGEILGVGSNELLPTVVLGALSIAAVGVLWRPLLYTSVLGEMARTRGVRPLGTEMAFLVVVALVTTMSVPVVGTLLLFSLMVGPPAAAASFTANPWRALWLSVAVALAVVWVSLAAAYLSNWPVGFFVGVGSAAVYLLGRLWVFGGRRRVVAYAQA